MIPEGQLKPCKHLLVRIPHTKLAQPDEFDVTCKQDFSLITAFCLLGNQKDLACRGWSPGEINEQIRHLAQRVTL